MLPKIKSLISILDESSPNIPLNLVSEANGWTHDEQKQLWKEMFSKKTFYNKSLQPMINFFEKFKKDETNFLTNKEIVDELIFNIAIDKKSHKDFEIIYKFLSMKGAALNWSKEQWQQYHEVSFNVQDYNQFLNIFLHKKSIEEWVEITKHELDNNKTQSVQLVFTHLLTNKDIEVWKKVVEETLKTSSNTQKKLLKAMLKMKSVEDSSDWSNKLEIAFSKIIPNLSQEQTEDLIVESLAKKSIENNYVVLNKYMSGNLQNLFNKINEDNNYIEQNIPKFPTEISSITFGAYKWLVENKAPAYIVNTILYKSLITNRLAFFKEVLELDKIHPNVFSKEIFAYGVLHATLNHRKDLTEDIINHVLHSRIDIRKWFSEKVFSEQKTYNLPLINNKENIIDLRDSAKVIEEKLKEYNSQFLAMILLDDLDEKETNKKRIKI